MKKIRCSSCKIPKIEKMFSWSNMHKHIRNNRCKECQKKLSKNHYSNKKSTYLNKLRLARERNKIFICDFLKNKFCVDCGENNIVVLEFDHIDPTKKERHNEISIGINDKWSIKRLKDEMGKCEIRCANCHKKRHAKESDSFRYQYELKKHDRHLHL